jgi:hypothetical protein
MGKKVDAVLMLVNIVVRLATWSMDTCSNPPSDITVQQIAFIEAATAAVVVVI